jgi:hypothetical protein
MRLSSAHSAAGAPNRREGLVTGPHWFVACALEPVAQRLGATGSGLRRTDKSEINVNITTGINNKGAPGWLGAPLLLLGLCSAVSYSPTPWRVQYHRRWRA